LAFWSRTWALTRSCSAREDACWSGEVVACVVGGGVAACWAARAAAAARSLAFSWSLRAAVRASSAVTRSVAAVNQSASADRMADSCSSLGPIGVQPPLKYQEATARPVRSS
jgi:hypothetical protein